MSGVVRAPGPYWVRFFAEPLVFHWTGERWWVPGAAWSPAESECEVLGPVAPLGGAS